MEYLIKNMKTFQPIFYRNWSYYFYPLNKKDWFQIMSLSDYVPESRILSRHWNPQRKLRNYLYLSIYFFALFCLVELKFRFDSIFCTWTWIVWLESIFVLGLELYIYRYFLDLNFLSLYFDFQHLFKGEKWHGCIDLNAVTVVDFDNTW